MTKQEAELFFERNPKILETMRGLQEDGLLEKSDIIHLYGQYANAEDASVNCLEAFLALGQWSRKS